MDFAVADADLIDSIHQLGNQIKLETGVPERRNVALRRNDHLCIFDGVIEIVSGHCRKRIALRRPVFKDECGILTTLHATRHFAAATIFLLLLPLLLLLCLVALLLAIALALLWLKQRKILAVAF